MKKSLKDAQAKYDKSQADAGWTRWTARISPETRLLIQRMTEERKETVDQVLNKALRLLSIHLE